MVYDNKNTNYNSPMIGAMLPRMRTFEQCAKMIKDIDPDTAITEWYIQCLVKDENSTFKAWCKTGVKYLINFDELLRYFQGVNNAQC